MKPEMFMLDEVTGILFNPDGRFHGWMFRRGPNGEWISQRKLESSTTDFIKI
jgi:hypothetical protein